ERDKKQRGLFARRLVPAGSKQGEDSRNVFLLEEDFINILPMDEQAIMEGKK
ncbi:MAG: hypothetical protein HY878_05180, partial [Deltaproteobacteria bacterium]|nr:hypothetical protein [Deltaproteobacteria bacterium]